MKPWSPARIGILGGGQLARMLILAGARMGHQMHVLCVRENDPAAQVTRHWHKGDANDASDLAEFLKHVDVVTFESEFFNSERLALAESAAGVDILPAPPLMGLLQDRLTQKKILDQFGIATAPWLPVTNIAEAEAAYEFLRGQVVFKKRRGGYDGYGTFVVRTPQEFKEFLPHLLTDRFIAESFARFRRELAVMLVRSRDGSVVALPWVESHQENARCLWVKGPVRLASAAALQRKLLKMLAEIDYVGAMGVEVFDLGSRGIWVNELAPRVHNSGHYSMNALAADQFELHLRAVLGEKLRAPEALARGFAMYNLLGDRKAPVKPKVLDVNSLSLHWYGKVESRPGRKMGHLNAVASTPERALARLQRARKSAKI